MPIIVIRGKKYEWGKESITSEEIRKLCGVPEDRRITHWEEEKGYYKSLFSGEKISLKEGINKFYDVPKGIKASFELSILEKIRKRELGKNKAYLLSQVYSVAQFYYQKNKNPIILGKNFDFIYIPDFGLTTARWTEKTTPIIIHIPPDYPIMPPVGFFLRADLGLKRGRFDQHFFKGTAFYEASDFYDRLGLAEKGWAFYCLKITGGWHHSPDPLNPNCLWDYINFIREALSTDREDFE